MRLLSQLSHGDGVSHHVFQKRYSLPPQPYPPAPPSSGNKISPALLFVIVILAALFFVAGLLHLLFRFLLKKPRPPPPSSSQRRRAADLSGPDALQRQLQQLFHLHDHGLDQALIDALPVFLYADVVGSTAEPFDCAVCLCEFDAGDELRLLPACGHAFHLCCIDTWLLSNSTCPLCRGNPALDPAASAAAAGDEEAATAAEADEEEVFPVRLGKFKNVEDGNGNGKADSFEGNAIGTGDVRLELGESSSGSLGARRCFSMGSYQYVEAGATLQVAFKHCSAARNGDGRGIKGREASAAEGKRLGIGGRRESFSVSKIWLWTNKKGKVVVPPHISALGIQLPWKEIGAGDARNLSMI